MGSWSFIEEYYPPTVLIPSSLLQEWIISSDTRLDTANSGPQYELDLQS